jgi:nucleoside-diphosphate-sugar epimerase
MRCLVTGGSGYVGSVLVPKLLDAGHVVTVVDLLWFGNHLKPHQNLEVVKADFRSFEPAADVVIHLAGIANDPTGDLDPKLTWEVNALGTMRLADAAYRRGVKQFIYASSGSVYGVSDEPQVTEDLPLFPLSEYNKSKMVAERCVLSYRDGMVVQVLRPATVCGFSPRMRLDVAVNMLTMQALSKGEITLHGGSQYRPNIHIEDMADAYLWMIDHPELTGVYNAGFENLPLVEIAARVTKRVGGNIYASTVTDKRSYRMNSDKLLATGFRQKHSVNTAIAEIGIRYKNGELRDDVRWYNLKAMPR